MQLTKHTKPVRVSNAVAAGAANANSDVVDLHGFHAVVFVVLLGAIVAGAVTGVKLQHGDLADGSDMADVEGSAIAVADTADNKVVTLEVLEPQKRYCRVVVTRATQNATIDGILALLHDARVRPTEADATQAGTKTVLGPVSGVA